MKNLNEYKGDAFLEFSDAIKRKTEPISKSKLDKIKPQVKDSYDQYYKNFKKNSLYLHRSTKLFAENKKELQSLYEYQNKVISDIKSNIKEQQIQSIRTTCQNCTINSVESMDHILPQSEYPELAINAYNLFPCCSKCNEYKNVKESSATKQEFLNLYLDKLPDIQYLFVDVFLNSGEIDFQYYLDNGAKKISAQFFNIIKNHYTNLHLIERMQDSARTYLSDFIASIKPNYKRHSKEYVIETTLEDIEDSREAYGYNYWKCSLKLALINSTIFWDHLDKQLLRST